LIKQNFLRSGVVANRCHHQTAGSPPTTFRQLMHVDSLHIFLKFGADPLVLQRKFYFLSVWLQGAITKRRVHREPHSASLCAWTGCTLSLSLGLIGFAWKT